MKELTKFDYGNPEDVAIARERQDRGCYACTGSKIIKGRKKCIHGIEGYPDHSAISCKEWKRK